MRRIINIIFITFQLSFLFASEKTFLYSQERINHFLTHEISKEFKEILGKITIDEIKRLEKKLWVNECGGNYDNLTFWSSKEEFASMGIAHMIWFPKGVSVPFTESFPKLLQFLEKYNEKIRDILSLEEGYSCPWKTRDEFYADFQSIQMQKLRQFLANTVDLQLCFVVKNFQDQLIQKLKEMPENALKHICGQIKRLIQSPQGLTVIMDYASFKGIANSSERYNGYGWGLFSVLELMKGKESGDQALREFVEVALFILKRRIQNAPRERHEERFLAGWEKRLATYLSKN
jgi:hypothetical protein